MSAASVEPVLDQHSENRRSQLSPVAVALWNQVPTNRPALSRAPTRTKLRTAVGDGRASTRGRTVWTVGSTLSVGWLVVADNATSFEGGARRSSCSARDDEAA